MRSPRRYNASTDKRSGMNRSRRGLCSRVWCREPAVTEWTTRGGSTRYACVEHELVAEVAPGEVLVAAGSGDGVYHDVPFLKKYGA